MRQPDSFRTPGEPWNAGPLDPLRQHCEDIIRSSRFADQPFFDPARAREFLDAAARAEPAGATDPSVVILRMATLSLMQQRFGIN